MQLYFVQIQDQVSESLGEQPGAEFARLFDELPIISGIQDCHFNCVLSFDFFSKVSQPLLDQGLEPRRPRVGTLTLQRSKAESGSIFVYHSYLATVQKMTLNLFKTLYLGSELTNEEYENIPNYRFELHWHVLYKNLEVRKLERLA